MISVERLRTIVRYDPETGYFFLLKERCRRDGGAVGSRVDRIGPGKYHVVTIDHFQYRAHRLAWLYMTGEHPAFHIDHINGIKIDNRFVNLRDATRSTNLQNQRRAKSDNRHGHLGVTPYLKRFKAAIKVRGKRLHIGVFDTPSEAAAAYLEAKRKLHDGCTI